GLVASRRAQDAAAASEARAAGGESWMPLPIAAATIDQQHRCFEASAALAACLRLERGDLVGLPIDDLFRPWHAPVLARHVDAALAGEPQRLRLAYANPELPERWFQIELAPQREAGDATPRCQLFAMEVTAEQQALAQAQNGERRLRAIMDQI